jgi:phospholipid-binding lipoprotein MlaA
MRSSRTRVQLLLASALAIELCAGPALAQSAEPYDPWERFNRRMYAIQNVLDRRLFGPLARGFGKTPSPVRRALVSFSSNLSEPLVFVNDILQGHIPTAARTFARFTMNTTAGFVGFHDVASHNHLPHHDNGFGTTLGRWGAQTGPYLFLPLVGPSDLRDGIGYAGNVFLNPFHYTKFAGKTAISVTTGAINGLNTRLQSEQALSNIQATSTDPYATLRSYFLQNRAAEISGNPSEPGALPEFDMPEIPSENTPAGSVAPPGAPPSVSQPPSAVGAPLSGEAGALPRPEATPSAPPTSAPPPAPPPGVEPSPPPSSSPRYLIAPDPDAPLRTAGGK